MFTVSQPQKGHTLSLCSLDVRHGHIRHIWTYVHRLNDVEIKSSRGTKETWEEQKEEGRWGEWGGDRREYVCI